MITNVGGEITLDTIDPLVPLLAPMRYKGAKGGRGSGKSHFFAEMLVEAHICDPFLSSVCIREVQKSLKYSAKRLVENKIHEMGVSHLFKITREEIQRLAPLGSARQGGVIIFQGMQDHTADSIKSLEDFGIAWCEEAQRLSARSLKLLLPTMRKEGSEVWFSWNPDQPDDPVEKLFAGLEPHEGLAIHVNFDQNPLCPQTTKDDAARHRRVDPETYDHIYLGAYNTKREAIIFNGAYREGSVEVGWDWEPMHGLDWGFASDPTAVVRCYYRPDERKLYITAETGGYHVELDDTPPLVKRNIPDAHRYKIRADNARPESISYCKRNGLPFIESVEKWPGSVEDGIAWLRALDEIVVDPSCSALLEEFRLYCYKVDRLTGDVLPAIVDKNNHYIDALRYACAPLIRNNVQSYEDLI